MTSFCAGFFQVFVDIGQRAFELGIFIRRGRGDDTRDDGDEVIAVA